MRIKSVSVKNFRTFKDCTLNFEKYTSLVGTNGAGKSTILFALNVFFREIEGSPTDVVNLDAEDFHEGVTKHPIEISVTFCDLNNDAEKEFSNYVRHGELTIMAKAVFDPDLEVAKVEQFGQRRGLEEFRDCFKLLETTGKSSEAKDAYRNLREKFKDLPEAKTGQKMREALLEYETNNIDKCVLIPSQDQFYGISKGKNKLEKYVQWVYVPAVKDATEESVEGKGTALGKSTALGRILSRTFSTKASFESELSALKNEMSGKYLNLLKSHGGHLKEVSNAITSRLGEWCHPDARAVLEWSDDLDKSLKVEDPGIQLKAGERVFEGELARFGHGFQRSYLLALLQELAFSEDESAPTLILGCEEPELYQHPSQARHLSDVLEGLSTKKAQVIVSTHSPYFVRGEYFESLRMVRYDREKAQSCIFAATFEEINKQVHAITGDRISEPDTQMAKLEQSLQPGLSEMFFAPKIVFVEGAEDEAYITSLLIATDSWSEYRRCGTHIVRVNGKNGFLIPLIITKILSIPRFVVFDADANVLSKENKGSIDDHKKKNAEILSLVGGDASVPFPVETVFEDRFVQWRINIGDEVRNGVSDEDWQKADEEACSGLANTGIKNPVRIGRCIHALHKNGKVPNSLNVLVDKIMEFSKGA